MDKGAFRRQFISSGQLPGQRLPLIRQQFAEAIDRMAHNPAEHVVEVFPGIDIAVFAGLDETHV